MKNGRYFGQKRVKVSRLSEVQRPSTQRPADPNQQETDPGYYTPDGSFIALPARPRTNSKPNTG
jgi:hypothetical protein